MVVDHVRKVLKQKSKDHQEALRLLGESAEDGPLGHNVVLLEESAQLSAINTVILDPQTDREDFIFNLDRITTILIEKATESLTFLPKEVTTPNGNRYQGLSPKGVTSAVIILRGGSIMENGLHLVIPDCQTGRMLMQTSTHTGEPELHFLTLSDDISSHSRVLLLDPQMSSGSAALMAVRILRDHGVEEERIVFVTYFAGRKGLARYVSSRACSVTNAYRFQIDVCVPRHHSRRVQDRARSGGEVDRGEVHGLLDMRCNGRAYYRSQHLGRKVEPKVVRAVLSPQ